MPHSRITSVPLDPRPDGSVFNASGVVEVGPGRFLFVDNHDPVALFEITLDASGRMSRPVQERALAGSAAHDLSDPEGLARIDVDGELQVIVASSLARTKKSVHDGLIRVYYAEDGGLRSEAMPGFREWLLDAYPDLVDAAETRLDDGGLNIEGLAWDSKEQSLIFGLRSPADRNRVRLLRVGLDPTSSWSTSSLTAGGDIWLQTSKAEGAQGVRDISFDASRSEFLVLLGGPVRRKDSRFRLCRWDGISESLIDFGVDFDPSMKPEGITAFGAGEHRRALIVDDAGGYATIELP
uniref:DUF3616 domain-containing protein n=1 Tax=Gordonia sp. B7-2 TaxID=3420932 RepID=UPI003D948F33